jgi:hypothetical protein
MREPTADDEQIVKEANTLLKLFDIDAQCYFAYGAPEYSSSWSRNSRPFRFYYIGMVASEVQFSTAKGMYEGVKRLTTAVSTGLIKRKRNA